MSLWALFKQEYAKCLCACTLPDRVCYMALCRRGLGKPVHDSCWQHADHDTSPARTMLLCTEQPAVNHEPRGACPTEVRETAHCSATMKQHMQHHPTPCTWAEPLQARETRQSGGKQKGAFLSEVTVIAHCFTTIQSHRLLGQYTNQCLAKSGEHGRQ